MEQIQKREGRTPLIISTKVFCTRVCSKLFQIFENVIKSNLTMFNCYSIDVQGENRYSLCSFLIVTVSIFEVNLTKL